MSFNDRNVRKARLRREGVMMGVGGACRLSRGVVASQYTRSRKRKRGWRILSASLRRRFRAVRRRDVRRSWMAEKREAKVEASGRMGCVRDSFTRTSTPILLLSRKTADLGKRSSSYSLGNPVEYKSSPSSGSKWRLVVDINLRCLDLSNCTTRKAIDQNQRTTYSE